MSQVLNVPCPHCQSAIQVDRGELSRPGGLMATCAGCREQVVLTARDIPSAARRASREIDVVGTDLIVMNGAEGPERCVKCNAPAQWRWSKTLYWHSPVLGLLILVNVVVYLIVALIVRKSGRVTFYLCPEHLAKRRRNLLIGWLIFASSIVFWIAAGALSGHRHDQGVVTILIIVGVLAFLIGLIVVLIAPRVLTPRRIEGDTLTLKGAGPEFLHSLSSD